jgi:hypothetical protein
MALRKSPIVETISELYEEHKLLLARFNFFRADSWRSNSRQLVATIAYQVAVIIEQSWKLRSTMTLTFRDHL